MENLLKKGHSELFPNSIPFKQLRHPYVHPDLQSILSQHQLFLPLPMDLPPSRGVHDHSIPLVPGNLPPNVRPYRHPFSQRMKLRKLFKNCSK
jgi:hypothetical protein